MSSYTIEVLTPASARRYQSELIALLADAVDDGASVGFLPPLATDEAAAYWQATIQAVAAGERILLVAHHSTRPVAGTVQLDLAQRANATHRAEVAKLIVHRSVRRQGLGRALMTAIEEQAHALGRTTLVLDTRLGDPSERLYRALGWQPAGTIPSYARSANGRLEATAIYYRLL